MPNTVISVEHLTKRYDLGVIGTGTLSRDLNRWWARLRHQPDPYTKIGQEDSFKRIGESILALDDVSFTVQQGEALGIIGRNGAGKSTLLKILSRVTAPTSGVVKVKGRIGSLLEVGTGFHPELTGRENVYLNGAILGMRKDEVDRKFDEIVDFSGVEKFIDTPVKRYSSGMYVRLAFAVAAHLDPEILIVDEVLAVGDAEFQKKCLGKMGDVAGEGRTVLFVSHNMAAIQQLCPYAFRIELGRIVDSGKSPKVVQNYLEKYNSDQLEQNIIDRKYQPGDSSIRVVNATLGIQDDPKCGYWVTGKDCMVEVIYKGLENKIYNNIELAFGIRKLDQTRLLYIGTKVVNQNLKYVSGSGSSLCMIKRLPLEPGQYSLNIEVKHDGNIVDLVAPACVINVIDGDYYGTGVIWPYGGFLCEYTWMHFSDKIK